MFGALTLGLSMTRVLVLFSCAVLTLSCGGERGRRPQGERTVCFECPSPDGRRVAAFYTESGGGAAGWAYEHVEVRSPDDAAPSVVLTLKNADRVLITWRDTNRVRIRYPDSARVDHWQSWFGRMANGLVELSPLASEAGSVAGEDGGCDPGPSRNPAAEPSVAGDAGRGIQQ
jgi:hypothetical protein